MKYLDELAEFTQEQFQELLRDDRFTPAKTAEIFGPLSDQIVSSLRENLERIGQNPDDLKAISGHLWRLEGAGAGSLPHGVEQEDDPSVILAYYFDATQLFRVRTKIDGDEFKFVFEHEVEGVDDEKLHQGKP